MKSAIADEIFATAKVKDKISYPYNPTSLHLLLIRGGGPPCGGRVEEKHQIITTTTPQSQKRRLPFNLKWSHYKDNINEIATVRCTSQ